ncbi:MAG: cytochrome c biogenesis CcdA family protein [Candidatus Hodarchaeota archaeon]
MLIFGINIDESIGLPLFFLVGLYVALSPCLFPIMPLTVFRIMNKGYINDSGVEVYPNRKMVLKWVVLLTSGIIISFLVATLIILYVWSSFGLFLIDLYLPLTFLLGTILLLMGIFLIFPVLSEKTFARIPIPQIITNTMHQEEYRHIDLFLIGFCYSFIALPCAFPVFIVLLTIILSVSNFFYTTVGMGLFSVGLFIPYLILVFVTAEARTHAASLLAGKFRIVEIIIGFLVIIFGFLFIWPSFGGPSLFILD